MTNPNVGDRLSHEGTEYVVNRVTVERNGRLVIDCMSIAECQRRMENLARLLEGEPSKSPAS